MSGFYAHSFVLIKNTDLFTNQWSEAGSEEVGLGSEAWPSHPDGKTII